MLSATIKNALFGSGSRLTLMLIVFVGMFLPALPQVANYHSDEHYYTDSALFMLQHHDYLTPRMPDGTLRTKKPIVTYWALMAAYALLGIHFFSARLPFLLAGCGVLWLTYRMSWRLYHNRSGALLAAAILASNLQFVVLSLRSTPDILNTLFLNISLFGFIGLLFHQERRLGDYLCAYLGAALAIETKGLLGIAPVAFAFAFRRFQKDHKIPLRHLVHWPVILLSALAAISWYAYILFQSGPQALGIFFSDQVAGKIGGNPGYLFTNLFEYAAGILRNFLPWTFFFLVGIIVARRSIIALFKARKHETWFILGWFGLLGCIFIGSTDCRTRYFVPAYPLLSVMLASFFATMIEQKPMTILWQWCCVLVFGLIGCLGLVFFLAGTFLDWRLILSGLIVLGCVLPVLAIQSRNWEKKPCQPIWMTLVLLITIASLRGWVLPVFEFAPSQDLTRCILDAYPPHASISAWAVKRQNYTRQIYLLSKGRINIQYLPRGALNKDLGGRSPVLLSSDAQKFPALSDYRIVPCGFTFQTPRPGTIWRMISNGQGGDLIDSMRRPLYLAWCQTGP